MADHPDYLLPGLHFLAAQFAGEQAQQQQLVRAAIEAELPAGKVVDLLFGIVVLTADRHQAVAAPVHGLAQFHRHAGQQLVETLALQFPALVQQFARGQVGKHHAAFPIAACGHQQHRHRRVLDHGVQQQFTLHQ